MPKGSRKRQKILFALREKEKPFRYARAILRGGISLSADLHDASLFRTMKEAKEATGFSLWYLKKHYEQERVYLSTDRIKQATKLIQISEAAMLFGNAKDL